MPYTAGQKLRASQLLNVSRFTATGTSLSVTTQVATDIPSATVTFSVAGSSAFCVVFFSADVSTTVTTSNNLVIVNAAIDGTGQPNSPIMDDRVSRLRVQGHAPSALTAGSHTIKLQAARAQASGTFTVNGAQLTVVLFDVS